MQLPKLAALAILAVLTCVAVYVVSERTRLSSHATVPQPNTSSAAVPANTAEAVQKSIAVLPFVDLSEKHDQEYFSDGLTEELIDQLAEAPNLKVIARTSSFQFKGKNEDVRTIAGKLGVAHLLEGSVRKSGMALRITAQLIRASDGTHIWSHTYERALKDVFQVQDEIARTVVRSLTGALDATTTNTPAAGMAADVHDLILKGNYVFGRASPGDTENALGYYQRAVALDPGNAQAWTLLGKVHHWQGILRSVPIATARANAFGNAQRALEIDPGSAATHRLLGLIYDHFDWNYSSARREYQRSVELSRTSLDRALAASDVAFFDALRDPGADRVVELMKQNMALDPLNSIRYMQLSYWQLIAHRTADAITTAKKLVELNPTAAGAYAHYSLALIVGGKASEALAAAEKESDPRDRLASLVVAYWATGKRVESDAALNELVKHPTARPTDIAGALAYPATERERWIGWRRRSASTIPGCNS